MKKNFHALGKRALALLIVLTMCVSLLQVTAFAAPGDIEPAGEQQVVDTPENVTPVEPAGEPKEEPSAEPSDEPGEEPSAEPSDEPGEEPSTEPSDEPGEEPSAEPSAEPEVGSQDGSPVQPPVGKTEAVSQDKPVVVTKPAAPPASILTTPAGAFGYVVNTIMEKDSELSTCCKAPITEKGGQKICSNCGYTVASTEKPSEPEKHEHTYKDGKCTECGDECTHKWTYQPNYWDPFTHTATCKTCGVTKTEDCTTKDAIEYGQGIVKCILCNYYGPDPNTHHWSDKWEPQYVKGDDGNSTYTGKHTQKCTDDGCNETRTEECKFVATGDGTTVKCSVCGFVKHDDGMSGGADKECPDGKHEFGNTYQHNDGYHWQQCMNCGITTKHEQCDWSLTYKGDSNIVTAYVCSTCGNTKTTVEVPVCDKNDPTKGHDWQVNRTVLADDGKTQLVIVRCANCGAEKVDGKCNSTEGLYKLTVQCVDEQGKVLKTVDGGCYAKNAYYKVECPEIPGYTADQNVVYGNMPAEDTVIPVVYRGGYTLTIDYVYEGANTPFDSVSKTLKNGDEYSVTSPDKTKEGYELAASQDAVISGKIDGKSEHYKVEYKLSTYTWTIKYVDENDNVLKQEVHPYTVKTVTDLPMLSKDLTDLPGYVVKNVKGDEKPTAEKLYDATTVIVCGQESSIYTLTIDYIIDGQSKPFATHVETLANGATYNVKSPDKTSEGYALAAGQEDAVKSGTITGESVYYHVDYKPITYTWTINYVDENGALMEGMGPYKQTFDVTSIDSLKDVQSPTRDGYTANVLVVEKPTELRDYTITVSYSPSNADTFTLTVYHEYMNRDGTLNHRDTVNGGTFQNGQAYTTSPVNVAGYTLSTTLGNANGTFDGQNVVVTYVYTANAPTGGGGGGTPPVNPNPPEEPNPPVGPDDPIEVPDDPNVPLEPGPGTDDPQEPGPGDDVIIDDPNVPLAPGPDIPDVDIDDPDVPMTNKPTAPAEKNPVPQPTATGLTEIEDEDVPLAEVPQTGDNTGLWIAAAILAACGLVTLGKKREDA